jgi:hypothetical protein
MIITDNEFGMMYKTVLLELKVLSQNLPGETEENRFRARTEPTDLLWYNKRKMASHKTKLWALESQVERLEVHTLGRRRCI